MLYRKGPRATVAVPVAPADCPVTLDGVELGRAPLWVSVPPSERELRLSGACNEMAPSQLSLREGSHVVHRFEAPPLQQPQPVASVAPTATSTESGADLLAAAQRARASGKLDRAGALYRQLLAAYPSSAEGRIALMTLADMALRGGRPEQALRWFDQYLAGGGGLSPEAQAGRIEAFRALGRAADERSAIMSFLAAFPSSVHAPRLTARLEDLSK